MGMPVYYQHRNVKRYVDTETVEALMRVGLVVKIRSRRKTLYIAV